jgi:hypothetical protein
MRMIQSSFHKDNDQLHLTQVTSHCWRGSDLPQIKVVVSVKGKQGTATSYAWNGKWEELLTERGEQMLTRYHQRPETAIAACDKNPVDARFTKIVDLLREGMINDAHRIRGMSLAVFDKYAGEHYDSEYETTRINFMRNVRGPKV